MSFSNGRQLMVIPVSEGTLGTADTLLAWVIKKPMTIYRASFLVTTVLADFTVVPILTLSKTQASPVVAIDAKVNITLVDESAVGTEIEGVVNAAGDLPLDLEAGDTLTLAVSTAATGTTTGAGYWILESEVRGELA